MGDYMGQQRQYHNDVGAYNTQVDAYNQSYGTGHQGYTPAERVNSPNVAQNEYWVKQSKTFQDKIADLERRLAAYTATSSSS
jgi:hypothetical protein